MGASFCVSRTKEGAQRFHGESGKELREKFERDGFLYIKGFVTPEECTTMRQRMADLVAAWDPDKTEAVVFSTDQEEQEKAQGSSDYFLDSADRIHFFLEKDATDSDGKLKEGQEKHSSLNKVGHGLHVEDTVFREYSQSDKVKDLVNALGWVDPVLPQSMYIFKQPKIGGEVTSHQDSTFLHTEPRETCLGLWLSLHAATQQNGCVWCRPGSHKEGVRRLMVRNAQHFEACDKEAPQMIFKENEDSKDVKAWAWEGKMPPGDLGESGFVPCECEAGDLLLIHGQVDHCSIANTSSMQRETFQLHLVEGPGEGVQWAKSNWLQYPEGTTFPSLKRS